MAKAGNPAIPADIASVITKNAEIEKAFKAGALDGDIFKTLFGLGAFSNFFPEIKEGQWTDAIQTLLPAKLRELNIKAFDEGRKALACYP